MRHRSTGIAVAVLAALLCGADAAPAAPFAALLKLDAPNYTGGLTAEDRAVAEAIHAAMAARYTVRCPLPQGDKDALAAVVQDQGKTLPSLTDVDPDLVRLIGALDDPRQEIRDTAAYAIGLLGPGAKAAFAALTASEDAKTKKAAGTGSR